MAKEKPQPNVTEAKVKAAEERQKRQAEALRANLRRRKPVSKKPIK